MLARRGKGGVCIGRAHTIYPEFLRDLTGPGDGIAALRKLKRRNQGVEGTLQSSGVHRSSGEARFLRHHHVYLRTWAIHLDSTHCTDKIFREVAGWDHPQERALRVGV